MVKCCAGETGERSNLNMFPREESMPKPRIKMLVDEGAIRTELEWVVQRILARVKDKYPKVCSTICEPKYIDPRSEMEDVDLLNILNPVHCVFIYGKRVFTLFHPFGRREKVLLLAITEPEIAYLDDGTPWVGDMKCFFRHLGLKDVILEEVEKYAETFNVEEISMKCKHKSEPPLKDTGEKDVKPEATEPKVVEPKVE
jgi:hypothetical protein